ncbi:hypothetical protein CJD36_003415 [Flavipsychrobacter stenotrophus]|uniref:Uncharacterized protein n=1 Tax=Flavipsychrobacter stenotrophus TaxID=2077091 RepID=A0A2S7T231_9BACT|nr:hypothetical protein [Flavipsychrobacter stenotrophus]PQJ12806.1 hypothetical protein CJD36_003415 [Flavipsychrobacter stenotrophus]
MDTTVFFEENIKDAGGKNGEVHFEMGRSSYLNGKNLIYLSIDGKNLILDENTGRELVDAFNKIGHYLSY